MDSNILIEILKNYISIFLSEYSKYLDKEQLDTIKNIDYDNILCFGDISYPPGMVNLNKIVLSSSVDDLINAMRKMPDYHTINYPVYNNNYSSYLKYICNRGYDSVSYYIDHLIYLVFKMVIKNKSGLIDGFINKEVGYLKNKYGIRALNLYKREEVIAEKVINIITRDNMLKVLFMDNTSAFKYLSETSGYRYAKLFYDISNLIDEDYQELLKKDYPGFIGIIDYAKDYDSILYGDVYNYLLDFSIENKHI